MNTNPAAGVFRWNIPGESLTVYQISLTSLRRVIRHLAGGMTPERAATRSRLDTRLVGRIAVDYGWPDRVRLAQASRELDAAWQAHRQWAARREHRQASQPPLALPARGQAVIDRYLADCRQAVCWRDLCWARHLAQAIRFRDTRGVWPSRGAGDKLERQLGEWLARQWVAWRKNLLPAARQTALTEAGATPPVRDGWWGQLDQAIGFHTTWGRWPAPGSGSLAEHRLLWWMYLQHLAGHQQRLPHNRWQAFTAAGADLVFKPVGKNIPPE